MASPTLPHPSPRHVAHARNEPSDTTRIASLAPTVGAVNGPSPQPRRRSDLADYNINQHGIENIVLRSISLDTKRPPDMVLRRIQPTSPPPPPPARSRPGSSQPAGAPNPRGYRDMRGVRPPPPPPPHTQSRSQTHPSSTPRPPPPPPPPPPPHPTPRIQPGGITAARPPPPPPPRLGPGNHPGAFNAARLFNSPLAHGNSDVLFAGSETASNRTPLQSYDFGSSSSDSESDSSDATSIFTFPDGGRGEIWATVGAKQEQVWRLRSEMAKKRKELKRLLERMSNLDDGFMKLIRPYFAIINQFRELQAARDEYYPIVAAYDALEKELKDEEVQLETMEAQVVRTIQRQSDSIQPSSFPTFALPVEAAEPKDSRVDPAQNSDMDNRAGILLGISGERHEDIHPLYQELLGAVGDRELASEFCEEVKMRYEEILYGLETKLHRKRMQENLGRSISEQDLESLKASLEDIPPVMEEFESRFGVDINEDDLEFVQNYDSETQRAQLAFEKASQTVERLRDLCIQKGVVPKHASYNEQVTVFSGSSRAPAPADGNMSIETLPGNRSGNLANPRFPILLSNPSYVLKLLTPRKALAEAMALPQDSPDSAQRRAECMKELGITNLMKNAESKPDYINQWLIHRLRTTPLEAELMLTIFESSHKVGNIRKWQEDVLFHWRQDDAAKMDPSAFEGPQTPRDELDIDEHSTSGLNSVIEASPRARSEGDDDHIRHHQHHRHHSHHYIQRHQRISWPRPFQSVC
ncbi:hypothetical protein QBC44DRAFT_70249 [Cladorrhinum sp. PSN332]|nr:hypothetical protein QBC44DRAFT_70249 [Cladorrhinum sp. PSN332]